MYNGRRQKTSIRGQEKGIVTGGKSMPRRGENIRKELTEDGKDDI